MAAERADDFLRMIRRSQRGRLKVYLGYAAGVGKTYLMLQEAHRLKQEGVDVVSEEGKGTTFSFTLKRAEHFTKKV